jgi:hypothetical protein
MENSSKQNLHDVEARHTQGKISLPACLPLKQLEEMSKLRAILTGKNRNAFKGIQYFSLNLPNSTANNFHHFL